MHVHLVSLGNLRLSSILCLLAALLGAHSAAAAPPAIQIPRIDTPPKLADFEAMRPIPSVAERMLKVTGFIAREPADGAHDAP